ncbi:MAG: cobalamin B12-binding domain-containing protein [Planctomycetes bacterium]|nr:cobalamin B12-binding domain-containing protein [Planctomycetota bacterium]MBI3844021.1 cobalamin B12-binding domain-containing protein [Planctomycetota bacterium]
MRALFVEHAFDKLFSAGVAALSATLKRDGHDVELLRVDHHVSEAEYRRELRARTFDLLAFPCMSFQWEGVKRFAAWSRAVTDAPIVVGGYHPTFWPEAVIAHPAVDLLCRGQGEGAILDLARTLDSHADPSPIENLWVKSNGAVVRNECRPLISDLDALPPWDRELFGIESLMEFTSAASIFHGRHHMPAAAGRGCPYNCTYCSNHGLMTLYRGKGKLTRTRSVAAFLAELRGLLARYPQIEMFEFWDEIFGVDKHWLREFSSAYAAEFDVPFCAFLRVELATDEVANLLAEAGCRLVLFGVEEGSEEYRKRYLNRRMSNRVIVDGFRRCRERGIETVALNMIGLPYETAGVIRGTIELNREIDPDILCVFIFQAFPGTDLFDLCVREGYVPPYDAETIPWIENPNVHLVQESITHDELMQCYRDFRDLQAEIERKRGRRFMGVTPC